MNNDPRLFTLDLTRHPMSGTDVTSWVLGCWRTDKTAALLLLTHAGEGDALLKRIRVRLSQARTRMRGKNIDQFTMSHYIFAWTDNSIPGEQREALSLVRRVTQRHKLRKILKAKRLRGNIYG